MGVDGLTAWIVSHRCDGLFQKFAFYDVKY